RKRRMSQGKFELPSSKRQKERVGWTSRRRSGARIGWENLSGCGPRPNAIVLTHAHPDHAWGLRGGAPVASGFCRESVLTKTLIAQIPRRRDHDGALVPFAKQPRT